MSVDSNFGVSAYPTFCLIGPDRTLLNRDIWPLTDITTFEATFPNGLEPEVMECTILGVTDTQNVEFSYCTFCIKRTEYFFSNGKSSS